jgi:hypothetical protein
MLAISALRVLSGEAYAVGLSTRTRRTSLYTKRSSLHRRPSSPLISARCGKA